MLNTNVYLDTATMSVHWKRYTVTSYASMLVIQ
jgi:hypothetical protein